MIRRLPFFYGWVIVGACFVVMMVSSGVGFYNASVILSAATDELDASVRTVSFGPTLFFGISGITGFAISKRMERIDIRWFYLVGGILGAACLLSLRIVDSVAKYYLFFLVFGIAFALVSLVPSTTLVARWFAVKRSVAMSIASTGISVGGIAITPLVITMVKQDHLAGASTRMALIWFLGIIPIALLLFRSSPDSIGLQVDGAPASSQPVTIPGATLAEARGSRFFRLLSATYGLIFLAQVGTLAHLFNLTRERADDGTATAVLAVLSLASISGRLIGGVIVLRVPVKTMTGFLMVVQSVALGLLALAHSRSAILIAAALFGLAVGNLLMLQPLLIAEAFGVKEYSRVYSLSGLIGTVGVASGPFVIGAIRDASSYRESLFLASFATLGGVILLRAAGPTEQARSTWSTP